ncbi:MAG: NifU family protein [Acetobacteraceae bacterium]
MFIQTEATPNPSMLKFLPDRPVMGEGTANFLTREGAARSPLASRLYEIDGVTGVFFGADFITVTKADDREWMLLKSPILGAIMQHFTSGQPVMEDEHAGAGDGSCSEGGESDFGAQEPVSDAPQELVDQVRELIETRLQPAVHDSGGDIEFRSFVGATVNLRLQGSAHAMLSKIEAMLRHYVPDIEKVQDVMDAIPKPGLETPTGKAVREVLDSRINPAVAGHGGHISLIDVRGPRVFLRLEGGCQGCGMADVTLKQGVEAEIRRAAPEVQEVLDVTDHAAGSNPYYQPGKGGASSMA